MRNSNTPSPSVLQSPKLPRRTRLSLVNIRALACRSRFIDSGLNYDATLRNLELIGEAAAHVPEAVRAANPQIPWRLVIATRNRLIHGYLGIDDDTLWSIIIDDIPALLSALQTLKSTLDEQ